MTARLLPGDYRLLRGVHPVLSATVQVAAARYLDQGQVFRITSALRSAEEQEMLFRAGKTPLRSGSKHQLGLAVDLAILSRDRAVAYWDLDRYAVLHETMQSAFAFLDAASFGYALTWGGMWHSRDATHWELAVPA